MHFQHSIWLLGPLLRGAAIFALATPGLAQTTPFQLPENAIRSPRDLMSQDELFIHPFRNGAALSLDFGRQGMGAVSLDRDFVRFMMQRGLDPRLGLNTRKKAAFGLAGGREENYEYRFSLMGIPVCDHQIKVQWVKDAGPAILGTMPRLNADATVTTADWPSRQDAFEKLAAHAQLNGIYEDLTDAEASACWWAEGGEVYPSWDMILSGANGLSYSGIASSDEVYKFEPRYFHVQGVSKIYPQNAKNPVLQEFTLNDLDGTGFLESKYFYTELDSSSDAARAQAEDHRFIYAIDTSEFVETSVFTNATRTLQWYFDRGYDAFGGERIALIVHAILEPGGTNNAQYMPPLAGKPPTISVGDGDGVVLQNLATDRDVVSHEFGHHVVYESVKAIEGEGLVLHEGLADYFAFAKSNDPCLGESVCTATNAASCQKYQGLTCLRSAANNYTLATAPGEAHSKSQFISGMLWDLRETNPDDASKTTFDKLVLNAVSRMLAKSKYEHLVLALLISDRNIYNAKYCEAILAGAKARGLESRIGALSCSGNLPELTDNPSNATSISGASSSKRSNGGRCGVVGLGSAPQPWLVFLALLMPLGMGFIRNKRK